VIVATECAAAWIIAEKKLFEILFTVATLNLVLFLLELTLRL